MELLHGLAPEQKIRRKILLLEDCQSEVLALAGSQLCLAWDSSLKAALAGCARRGLRVRVLLEPALGTGGKALAELRQLGIEARLAPRPFSWMFRPSPVVSEFWSFDRAEAITTNERVFASASHRASPALRTECLLGAKAAQGLASYLERRWDAGGRPLSFSVRHKEYSFYSGMRAELSFYGVLQGALKNIIVSVPSGRISRRVELALHTALNEGIQVGIYTNADRDDAPGLRRLRRLSAAGAMVKICGRRLRSELAILDGQAVYLGTLPSSWRPWPRAGGPVVVMKDETSARDLLEALDSQVSVEIAGAADPSPSLVFP